VLAGVIINDNVAGLSWRPIFLVNVILGIAGLALAARILPRLDGQPSTQLDGWGPWPVACLVTGTASLAVFGRRQVTAADPLLAPGLLRNRGFTSGMVAGLAIFAATTGLVYVRSLFLQLGQHASGSLSSVQQLASGIGSAVVTTVFLHGSTSGAGHAMTASLIVVASLLVLAAPLVALMPAKAPVGPHPAG
jgi:hypothetical protein